jgi:acetyltransferase-like isoleucine patch superfamily enzyme
MKSRLTSKIIKFIYPYTNNIIRKYLQGYLAHTEKGYYFSQTLREIYKQVYDICIGYGSYGCFVPSRFPQGTVIGNYCSIAKNVTILNANHPYERASMSPIFYLNKYVGNDSLALNRSFLNIGNDVWIGQDVIITNGCKVIGNGAIIGAGSIVTKDVKAYSVVAGNPAREIKMRFDSDTIEILEKSKWYEYKYDYLIKYINYIRSPKEFAEIIIKDNDNV